MEHPAEDGVAVARRGGFVEMLEAVELDVGGLLGVEHKSGYTPATPQGMSLYAPSYHGRLLCFGGGDGRKPGGGEHTNATTSSSSSNSGLSKNKAGGREEGKAGNVPKKPRKAERQQQQQQQSTSSNGGGTGKARKEKIGDRVIALQQLVSPFGKSDTAAVLHEALGYIRFLHDQVQVLSSPYLQQRLPSSAILHGSRTDGDLRSRGLCLVPLSSTTQLERSSNGADLWSAVSKK